MEDENNQKEIIIDNIIKKITNSIERKVKQLNSIETDLKEKKKKKNSF